MSQNYKEPKCECGHYLWLHAVPGVRPTKIGGCGRLTGWGTERLTECACTKFTKVVEA